MLLAMTSGGAGPRVDNERGGTSWRFRFRQCLRLGRPAAERRLEGYVVEERAALQRRKAASSGGVRGWAETTELLLQEAEAELERGNLDTANLCVLAARRHQIWAYDAGEMEAARLSLSEEGTSDKIHGWRRASIVSLLQDVGKKDQTILPSLSTLAVDATALGEVATLISTAQDVATGTKQVCAYLEGRGTPATVSPRIADLIVTLCSAQPTVQTVAVAVSRLLEDDTRDRALLYRATHILDEGLQNDYRKIQRQQSQLLLLSGMLALIVAGLFILVFAAPIGLASRSVFGGRIVAYVCLFGALGGCISAIQTVARSPTALRIPEQLAVGSVTFVRPLLGAAGAVVVYIFLLWGILPFRSNNNVAALGAAFIGGFSERLIISAVGAATGKNGASTR